MSGALLSPEALEGRLREIGAARYHDRHPFHHLMRDGKLTRGQVQAWALNRYYYQARIPAKDAYLIARLPNSELRREWRRRLIDHDGEVGRSTGEATGGIARWLKLCDGLGLDRDYVISTAGLLPTTRFAVDAYVNFVRDRSLLEAVASCLTEMFSPQIIAERVEGMLRNYDFITRETLAYFTPRLTQAPTDVAFALAMSNNTPTRRRSRRRCSIPCASNATCCGRSSMRSISLMSSRAWSRPVHLYRRTIEGERDRRRHGFAFPAACEVPFRRAPAGLDRAGS